MRRTQLSRVIFLALAAGLSGCASQTSSDVLSTGASAPVAAQASPYQLTADEMKDNCKALTGRMQVRLLQMRASRGQSPETGVSRTMQTAAATVFGGTTAGTDPGAQYARDLGVMRAYNERLRALKCATFDIDAELTPNPSSQLPTPKPQPKKP